MTLSNTTPKARNEYVVQHEGGHPGYRNYVFSATDKGLRELSDALLRLARSPAGARIDYYVTERGNPDSLGALAFVNCSEQTLADLQRPTVGARVRELSKSLLFVGGLVVFGVGAWHSASYLLQLVFWMLGVG